MRVCSSSAAAPFVVPDSVAPAWAAAAAMLRAELGASDAEAETMLRRAHGWGYQAYWRREKDCEAPDAAALPERLAVLRAAVGGGDDALRALVAAFPEALGLEAALVRDSVVVLDKLSIRGDALHGLLHRKPQVLGNNVDCSGDCIGSCARCWVRF